MAGFSPFKFNINHYTVKYVGCQIPKTRRTSGAVWSEQLKRRQFESLHRHIAISAENNRKRTELIQYCNVYKLLQHSMNIFAHYCATLKVYNCGLKC